MARETQLAFSSAVNAFPKSILVEIYQKQISVMAIFSTNFNMRLADDPFFLITASASVGIDYIYALQIKTI